MKKVLATDLDGTLFYPKRRKNMMTKKNIAFCRRFIENGNQLVLVTARSPFYTKKVEEKIGYPLDVVGMNGAYIVVDDKLIEEHFIDTDLVKLTSLMKEKFNIQAVMLTSTKYPMLLSNPKLNIFKKMFYSIYYKLQGVYGEDHIIDQDLLDDELANGKIYKVMFFFGLGKKGKKRAQEAHEYLRENYPNEFETSWTHFFVEITPLSCSKGESLIKYLDHRGYKKEQTYVVGDSGNDISMFKTFYENSFCMKHSPKNVKMHAKTIIANVSQLEEYL
ncbi:MAG: HAD-IIB family hydrolase [Bacilli bacterium]|jgi:Cof subfamily protein (haloacid dehalogenase superfamily)